MKFIPDIEFRLDKSIEYGDRIDRLLNKISRPTTPEALEGQEEERRGGDEGS